MKPSQLRACIVRNTKNVACFPESFLVSGFLRLTVLDVAPSREAMVRGIREVAAGRFRRPLLLLGIDRTQVRLGT